MSHTVEVTSPLGTGYVPLDDYIALAAALAEARAIASQIIGRDGRIAIQFAAQEIADVLATANPRFDRRRFLEAAALPPTRASR